MTASALARAIIARLEEVGYQRLQTPFQVASVRFDFTAVLQGRQGREGRGFDIVLIVDTSAGEHGDKSGGRTRQRIEALSRALDVSESRLVLTAILAGATLPKADVDAIARICRVLTVEGIELNAAACPATENAARELDDRLRILLPLKIEIGQDSAVDPIGEVENRLPSAVNRDLANKLLGATGRGDRAVSRAIIELLEEALKPGVPS
jgi:hypothetical protein